MSNKRTYEELEQRVRELEQDLVESKQAEELLRESEQNLSQTNQMLQTVLDTIPVRIFWKDKDLNYLGCNRLFAVNSGFKNPEDIIGRDDYTMGWKNEAERYRSDDQQVLESRKKTLNCEETQTTPKGKEIGLRTSKIPLEDSKGMVFGILGTCEDITERKQVGGTFEKNGKWLSTTLNSIGAAVIATDTNGNVTLANPVAESLTGWGRKNAIGKPLKEIFNIINEETRKLEESPLEKAIETGARAGLENHTVLIAKDGREIPIEGNGSPIRNDKGEMIGIVWVFRDIAERRQAEEALRRSERRYRDLFEKSNDAILFIDNRKLSDCNQATVDMLGYHSKHEFLHMHPSKLSPDDQPDGKNSFEKAEEMMDLALANGSHRFEWHHVKANGKIFPVEVLLTAISTARDHQIICTVWRDITARKLAEEERRRLSQFQESIIDNASIWLNVLDEKSNVVIWNKAAERISGYSREEVIGNSEIFLWSYPDEQYRNEIIEKVVSISEGEEVKDFETVISCKDGSSKTISWHSRNIVDDAEGNIGSIALGVDVTKHRQAEDALKKSEGKFKQIFENVQTPYYETSISGTLLEVSPSVENHSKYKREELIGKSILELYANPDERDLFVGRLLEAGELIDQEILLLDKDGGTLNFSVSAKLLENEHRIVGTLLDITERKEAEGEIIKLRNQLNNIFNSIPSIIVSVDVRSRIVNWNKKAEDTTNISQQKASGRYFADVLPQFADQQTRIKSVIEKGRAEADSRVSRVENGQTYFENITISPLVVDKVEGVVVKIDDVTERVRMEELIVQTEKMMSVGGLAAGMAHELNNPLAGMLQGLQNVQQRLSTDLESNRQPAADLGIDLHNLQLYLDRREISTFFNRIRESGRKATRIISNLQHFGRRSEFKMIPTNLEALLEKALELADTDYNLKKKYDFRNIRIEREFDSNLPLVLCSETEIEQVVLNLLSNAAYAMTEKGQENPPQINIRLLREEKAARIEIEDNGSGIEAIVRKRIFEPFFTTKPVGEGTGLGLSVSFMIVTNNHKGTIEVETELGSGTKFVIRLPLERENHQAVR